MTLTLEGWGRLGEALATWDDKPVFVFGGIPGEVVEAEVLRQRRGYLAAQVTRVLEPSPDRAAPPCPYFGACTGCQWQHIRYERQLEIKRGLVVDALERVGGFQAPPVAPTLPAPEQYGYRNHARFTTRRDGSVGFVHRETRRFVLIERCMLMHPWINEALAALQGRCGETTQMSVRYGVNTGDYLVQPTLKNPEIALKSGQKHYQEALQGHSFRVASPSFFQVNTRQAERIVSLVVERLALTAESSIVDAYAGVGTFAILLASHCRSVVAIEESPSAVEDARSNAEGIGNVEFVLAKTEQALADPRWAANPPDGVVLDPPRKGCHPAVLDALAALAPKRIVYVSCDPATLARDLKPLCQGPYRLEEAQPVDMFSQTYHVECVATLVRKD